LALTLPAPDQDGFHISLFCPLVVLSSSRTSVISFMSRNGAHDPWLAWCWLLAWCWCKLCFAQVLAKVKRSVDLNLLNGRLVRYKYFRVSLFSIQLLTLSV